MISQRGDRVESANRQAFSEELAALGNLPNEAELHALIERYAGSSRVTCEQADLFFASVGEVLPRAPSAAEVARGSWLNKLGPRSSAPPKTAEQPVLSLAPPPAVVQDEPITIEQGLSHLPAATYSAAPPPSALPSDDAPVALPLSSKPAPPDSLMEERWGQAEPAAPQHSIADAVLSVAEPDDAASAEEDALLDQWSDALDQQLEQAAQSQAPEPEHAAPSAPEVEPVAAAPAARARRSSRAPWVASEEPAPEPPAAAPSVDAEAPLSAAELSLLDQWSSADLEVARSEPPAEPEGRRSSGPPVVPAHLSQRPAAPAQQRPAMPQVSQRPPAMPSQRPAVAMKQDEAVDVEVEEIELDPDDLLEIDAES
jgi:hypothetical protein